MGETIRRFWRPSLGDSFFRYLPLVRDSRHEVHGRTLRKLLAGSGNLRPLGALNGLLGAKPCLMRYFPRERS